MTNKDRIQQMDGEELAKTLKLFAFCERKGCPAKCGHYSNRATVACKNRIVKWLSEEAQ